MKESDVATNYEKAIYMSESRYNQVLSNVLHKRHLDILRDNGLAYHRGEMVNYIVQNNTVTYTFRKYTLSIDMIDTESECEAFARSYNALHGLWHLPVHMPDTNRQYRHSMSHA